MKANKTILDELTSFSWKNMNELLKSGTLGSTKKQLSKETYLFIAKEKNLPTVVEMAYTSLQKTDPAHATIEEAARVAEEMQTFARKMIEDKTTEA